jgi:hypothetical protein
MTALAHGLTSPYTAAVTFVATEYSFSGLLSPSKEHLRTISYFFALLSNLSFLMDQQQ